MQGRTGHKWWHNMVHVRFVLDSWGCRHTHRICNTLFFHRNSGVANLPHWYFYMFIACLVIFNYIYVTRKKHTSLFQTNLIYSVYRKCLPNKVVTTVFRLFPFVFDTVLTVWHVPDWVTCTPLCKLVFLGLGTEQTGCIVHYHIKFLQQAALL